MPDHPPITAAGFGDESSAPGESPIALLRTLAAQVEELRQIEQRRAGTEASRARMFAAFGWLITAAAIAAFTWVWSIQGDMGAAQSDIRRNAERFEEHRARGGPLGHPDSVIERALVSEGRITALEAAAIRIDGRLERIETNIAELVERGAPRRPR